MEVETVSFVVIALNESKTIDAVFESLQSQTYPHEKIEVVLVDSASKDDTKAKMLAFRAEDNSFRRVVVLDNPQKTLPCGWNVALNAVQGDTVLRVDAHTSFSPDFIERNVRHIENGEDISSGKVISVPAKDTAWCVMLNEAENSMFGGSFAAFRRSDTMGYVDTAAFAMYRKSIFDMVGRFNEQLPRTEDNEMHARMRRAGYRFFYDPQIVSCRKTRSTLYDLLKQKYLNGYWIGRTLGIAPGCFALYHFVPLVFVLIVLATTALACGGIFWPSVVLWSTYAILNLSMMTKSIISCQKRNIALLCLPIVFFLVHMGYGIGTLIGFAQIPFTRYR